MLIKNPETIPKNNTYVCNKTFARWLIYEKHLPLLAKSGRLWYFAKTDSLNKAIKEAPVWLNIVSKF